MSAKSALNTSAPKLAAPAAALPFWFSMANAGTAGCIAWVFTHPFELLKNKVILSKPSDTYGGLMKEIYHQQGSIYKGLSGGLGRQVVYTTCRLSFYDPIKAAVVRGDEATVAERTIAGALAGGLASMLSSPVEVCLVLQTKNTTKLSLTQAAGQVMIDGGITGFWRGCGPLVLRAMVVGVSQVACYDQIKTMLVKRNEQKGKKMSREKLTVYSSAMTGLVYSAATMPIELSRVRISAFKRIAADGSVLQTPSMVKVLTDVIKKEGTGSIFRSFVPYYLRCSVHTIFCFFILEQLNHTVKNMRSGNKSVKQ